MVSPLPDYAFKYQKIWIDSVNKPGLLIPISFKKDTAYKCRCIDQTYGRPDPSCRLCAGTGYTNQQEIENRKWVAALAAPLDKETIEKYALGNYVKSSRVLLISYPIAPEFTRLYDIQPRVKLTDADGIVVNADFGFIVQPEDQEAKMSYKEKLYTGTMWQAKEIEFTVLGVESYKVSEFPIGQKVIVQQTTISPGKKRFIPKE